MEKYVKLDDVENKIIALSNITSSPFIDCNTAIYGLLSGLIQSIKDLPTKELDDFTEGEWKLGGLDLYSTYKSRCSECGQFGDEKWNYCPRCGSKMKKGKEIKYITQQGVTETINIDDPAMISEMLEKAFHKLPKELKTFIIPAYKE